MLTTLTALLVILIALPVSVIRYVPAGQVHSLHRRGRPTRLLQPGLHLVMPVLDKVVHKINLAGQILRFEEPLADAHEVRGTVYWQVLEPERADPVFEQVDQLIRHGASEVLREASVVDRSDRRNLGTRVKQSLNHALRERGMLVTRVELDAA
ncbi:MAG: SPFH domain-containing protein [Rhodanobacter sp.]|jgi:hypothetical protein|nr:SPFH domain-containing protein [Rhodanobacter sp.]